jgi:hypothetical protein
MTSFNLNSLLKSLPPNTVTLRIRALIYDGENTIQIIAHIHGYMHLNMLQITKHNINY